MKKLQIFTERGWFAKRWGNIFSFGGLFLAVVPWFLDINTGFCILLACVGSVISLIGSYEAKAKQFGFQAPFTRDPLGWRKAKQTYQVDEVVNGSAEKDSQP